MPTSSGTLDPGGATIATCRLPLGKKMSGNTNAAAWA